MEKSNRFRSANVWKLNTFGESPIIDVLQNIVELAIPSASLLHSKIANDLFLIFVEFFLQK